MSSPEKRKHHLPERQPAHQEFLRVAWFNAPILNRHIRAIFRLHPNFSYYRFNAPPLQEKGKTMEKITSDSLFSALKGNVIAIRRNRRLQPAEGVGGKIFPASYSGGVYAEEERMIDGKQQHCVIIDSVQSQANRIEEALKLNYYKPGESKCDIPVVDVTFTATETPEVGHVTSLDAPHRIADAILRDSELDGKLFRETEVGKACEATQSDATALFRYCPTALIFGIWDSTGPRGGLGTKFQRSLVSEIIAVNAVKGVKSASRIDPLNIATGAGPIYKTKGSDWSLEEIKGVKGGKPSEANHGNVTPTIDAKLGGITCDYAMQKTVISLPALRRLHFAEGDENRIRAVLLALALCGVILSEADMDLRSRCLLVPEGVAVWEFLNADGSTIEFTLDANDARQLLTDAINACPIKWNTDVVVLKPSDKLAQLLKKSRDIQAKQNGESSSEE
ncbi:MAG: type I-U CRISPR-associated RAMP protein Csb1/Cas7u [Lentisphaeria bacterium]|nr:type I-U CRISPR-associated RAMP protein Csb1/Cas7u [Lentisphaeria bacterium]